MVFTALQTLKVTASLGCSQDKIGAGRRTGWVQTPESPLVWRRLLQQGPEAWGGLDAEKGLTEKRLTDGRNLDVQSRKLSSELPGWAGEADKAGSGSFLARILSPRLQPAPRRERFVCSSLLPVTD